MVIAISITKKLDIKISLIPCKLFCFQAFLYSSAHTVAYTKPPEKPQLENSIDDTNQPPISDEIFKCSPKMGSYKVGDSTFYSLVANHASCGDFRSIEMVFDRMKRERRVFLEKFFILVFKAYGKAHLPEKAVELFERMADEYQCRPTVRSFNSVLNVMIQEGLLYRALEFHSYVVGSKSKNKNILPNVLTFNLIIKALCRLGLIDRGIEAFREMPVRKCVPDVFTYCTLMDGLCKENRLDEAVSLLDEMQIEGCFPNSATFNVLINGLCKKGDLSRAAKLVENMFLKGCVPNEVIYFSVKDKREEMAEPKARIESIYIYPIKSCRGVSVSEAPLVPTGFLWDRHWMVINSKGRACTQRVEPRLALVEVELPSEAFIVGWKPTKSSYLVIRAPGMNELKVSLSKPRDTSDGVSVWEWTGSALDEGAEASKWFSDYIGKPSRLVRFNADSDSRPLPEYAPTPGYNLVFTDQYQFLMLSKGSLDALNEQLEEPMHVNRFRPSIFIDGCEPFAEDFWKEIKINNSTFLSIQLCPRCKIPLVNQENGIPGSEPNETLMKFRSDKVLPLSTRQQGKVYFGQGLVCKDSLTGVKGMILKVGDQISVEKVADSYADTIA